MRKQQIKPSSIARKLKILCIFLFPLFRIASVMIFPVKKLNCVGMVDLWGKVVQSLGDDTTEHLGEMVGVSPSLTNGFEFEP